MNEKYRDYSRSALINELNVYKHAIAEGAQRIEERDQLIVELKDKIKKLQERLNSNFCPKYRLNEEKWYVEENGYCNFEIQVFNGTINEIAIADWDGEPTLYYKFDTSARYILEEQIFDSEAEAQKYLGGRK